MSRCQPNLPSLWGAHLFVPANRVGFLVRVPILSTRNVILDLEYATRLPYKVDGRHLCKHAIAYLRTVRPELFICVRTNLTKTGRLFEDDLRAIVPARPDAVRIPSVTSAEELRRADEIITQLEREHDIPPGHIKLHPMIESPPGLRNGLAIATASARNQALCLGGEDWAYNCGLTRTRSGKELDYVKASVVTVAAEAGLCAIDSVYNWLEDVDGLVRDTENSRLLGFRARAVTNPRQLQTVDAIYRPSSESLRKARDLLASLHEVDIYGTSHYVAHGVVLDPMAVEQARATVASVEGGGDHARS